MIREAKKEDLKELLELYLNLHEESIPEPSDCLSGTWEQILEDQNHHLIVNERNGKNMPNRLQKTAIVIK